MSDATSVLFGLEDEFSVLEVQRVDVSSVKVIIEQTARESPCPGCGVLSGAVKDRPVMRLRDLPMSGWSAPRFPDGWICVISCCGLLV
jgi:transposase